MTSRPRLDIWLEQIDRVLDANTIERRVFPGLDYVEPDLHFWFGTLDAPSPPPGEVELDAAPARHAGRRNRTPTTGWKSGETI